MRGSGITGGKQSVTTRRGRREARKSGFGRMHLEVASGGVQEAQASPSTSEDPGRRRHVRSLMLGPTVFALAAISLAVWSLHRATTISAVERRFECAQAAWGSVEEGLEVDGIVVRDERVFVSPIAGKVKLMVAEGERVRAGTVVAEIARDEARQQLEPPLVSAREELAKFDAYARTRLDELNRQVASCKLEVENEKRALDRAKASRDAVAERKHGAGLDRAKTELAAATRRLEAEKKTLEAQGRALAAKVQEHGTAFRQAVYQLRAETPGVVSFEMDGLEDTLTPVSAQNIAPDRVRALVASPVLVRDGVEVAQGEPVFRLIDNYRLLVLVVLPGENAAALASSRARVKFASAAGGGPFSARVVSQGKPALSGERAVLLEVSGFPQELCHVRRARVTLVTRTASGLTIPRRAVVQSDQGYAVYVPVNLGVMRKSVEIVAGDEDTVIVRGLKEGQRVLTNPSIVHEARVTVWR